MREELQVYKHKERRWGIFPIWFIPRNSYVIAKGLNDAKKHCHDLKDNDYVCKSQTLLVQDSLEDKIIKASDIGEVDKLLKANKIYKSFHIGNSKFNEYILASNREEARKTLNLGYDTVDLSFSSVRPKIKSIPKNKIIYTNEAETYLRNAHENIELKKEKKKDTC